MTIAKTEGIAAMYKGLVPTLLGVAPYAAINFASYDMAKKWLYHGERHVPEPPVATGLCLSPRKVSQCLSLVCT